MISEHELRDMPINYWNELKNYFELMNMPYDILQKSFIMADPLAIQSVLNQMGGISETFRQQGGREPITHRQYAYTEELKQVLANEYMSDEVKYDMLRTLLMVGRMFFGTPESPFSDMQWWFNHGWVNEATRLLPALEEKMLKKGDRPMAELTQDIMEPSAQQRVSTIEILRYGSVGARQVIHPSMGRRIKYLQEMKGYGENLEREQNIDFLSAIGRYSMVGTQDPLALVTQVGRGFLGRMPQYFTRHMMSEDPGSYEDALTNYLFPFYVNGEINSQYGRSLIMNLKAALGEGIVGQVVDDIQKMLHRPLMDSVIGSFVYDDLEKTYQMYWQQQDPEFVEEFTTRSQMVTKALKFYSSAELTNRIMGITAQRVQDGTADPDSPISRARTAMEGLGSMGAIMSLALEYQGMLDEGKPDTRIPVGHPLSVFGKTYQDVTATLSALNIMAQDYLIERGDQRTPDAYDVFSNYNWLKDNMLKIVVPTDITVWDLSVGQ
jgi:hypothetical protein